MSTNINEIKTDIEELADEVRHFMSATADVAGDKVEEARKRLDRALKNGRNLTGQACDSTARGAKAASDALRAHPYTAIGVALGVGAVLLLSARWCACHRD